MYRQNHSEDFLAWRQDDEASSAMSETTNPFEALLRPPSERNSLSELLEDVFLITIDASNCRRRLVYLEDVFVACGPQTVLDYDVVEHAIFERITVQKPEALVTPKQTNLTASEEDYNVAERKVLVYLFDCYNRLLGVSQADLDVARLTSLIARHVYTSIMQPELFQRQNLSEQLVHIAKTYAHVFKFFDAVTQYVLESPEIEDKSLLTIYRGFLEAVHADVNSSSIATLPMYIADVCMYFASTEAHAQAFFEFCQPAKPDQGISYGRTLLGAVLSLSILPRSNEEKFEFFENSLNSGNNLIQDRLWEKTYGLVDVLHQVVLRLLKCSPSIKDRTLDWISGCLRANSHRGKLWATHSDDFNPLSLTCISDGCMLTLSQLLLKLCQPFCANPADGKVLKVDPTYCAVEDAEAPLKKVHSCSLAKETCLVPPAEDAATSSGQKRPTADSYSFVSESFFLTHRSLDLGFRVASEKLIRLNQDMARVQRAYHDAVGQAGGTSTVVEQLQTSFEASMTRFLSFKAALLEPNLQKMAFDLYTATAVWLVQVAGCRSFQAGSFAPMVAQKVGFPAPDEEVPITLQCIPEFILENMVGFLSFMRRFDPRHFEEQGSELLQPLVTCLLVYMGSTQRVRNPHLRARLAEGLEALLPHSDEEPTALNPLGGFQRERLFQEHPHAAEMVPALLDVFVSIEMTGQSVQFEQKFNYRRPMYALMEYLWKMPEHRERFAQLAESAEKEMESVSPPIFLRFVNLLMNDAVFLLDEALQNMAQLRKLQTSRDNHEWDRLPAQERAQNLAHLQHIGMFARFDNILGRHTIGTLEMLTSHIRSVFTHPTMVDRVAAMLNYFLRMLVGPTQKNFKVRDGMKEYEFDPANTVLNICKIYANLGESDAFCGAVSQDGRSYSADLFAKAQDVLVKIGGGGLIAEISQLAERVARMARRLQTDEEMVAAAPEEFLDPIMSTLMRDPVVLPSSKQIVDRNTIARHLLSDQTDPFNRSPLTMDQVKPADELREQIARWLSDQQAKATSQADA